MSRIPADRYRMLFEVEDTQGFDHLDFIHRFTSPLMALLFSELFWPEFIETNDMVFLKTTFGDEADLQQLHSAIKQYGDDRSLIEKSFNTIEVPSLFGARIADTSDEEDLILANTLAAMWRARLIDEFPNRKFRVEVLDAGEAGEETAISFWQI